MTDIEKSAIERFKKRGYDRVTVSGFSARNPIEETYVLKQGNRGFMVSVEHSEKGSKLKDVILPTRPRPDKATIEKLEKDIEYAFQR